MPAKKTTVRNGRDRSHSDRSTKKQTVARPVALATRLIELYVQKQAIDAEMKQYKEELQTLLVNTDNDRIDAKNGTIKLKTTNAWKLPPVNESKARKILGESFAFYFKEKLEFGVETLGKEEINKETELGLQLKDLVEIKETQTWEIKPIS
jgi:hypothetical protein